MGGRLQLFFINFNTLRLLFIAIWETAYFAILPFFKDFAEANTTDFSARGKK